MCRDSFMVQQFDICQKTLHLRSIKVIVHKFSNSDLTSATGNSLRIKHNKKSRKEPQQPDSLS